MELMRKRTWQKAGAISSWLAVVLQFYLILLNRTESIPETIIRFFSFYTILTNLLVAFYFTSQAFFVNTKSGMFFSKPASSTAVTTYILLVGLGYQFLLRHIWDPQGLQWIVDELLHSVIPLLMLLYWWIFVTRAVIPFTSVFTWALYPVAYFGFVLLRGAASGFYPYYFIDVSRIGYSSAILQSLVMLAAFFGIALILILLKRTSKP